MWNVSDLSRMCLSPCHILYQFYVEDDDRKDQPKKLSCKFYQRSSDIWLANNWNCVWACMLTLLLAHQTNMIPYKIHQVIGDMHIYLDHIEQAKKQIQRTPLFPPRVKIINKKVNINDYEFEDIELINYNYYPVIKAKINI